MYSSGSLVRCGLCVLAFLVGVPFAPAAEEENLLQDPSFEMPKDRDQFGLVFAKWGGWKYEGDCDFRVGNVAHSGKHSCLLFGGSAPKIRSVQLVDLEPGRYRVTAFLRGLNIGTGVWNQTTEFMFDNKYMALRKNGTFGWTRLSYVADVAQRKKAGPSFGLMAPGYLWIDDVSLVKVGSDVPLTPAPVLDREEAPLEPPGELGPGAVRCPECGDRNMPAWKTCYACGTALEMPKAAVGGPAVKTIASFEGKNPFDGGKIVAEHATDGRKALRIDKSYVGMGGVQDWSGYDLLKADIYTDAKDPLPLYVEVRDAATRDYWTRVNYHTVVPPGESTLAIPVQQLYVGEKSRPGRMLLLNQVTRLVFSIGDRASAPLYLDNVRLERDTSAQSAAFDGLYAFDFGTSSSPLMDGFVRVSQSTLYTKGRGFGLKDARIWRAYNVLQPDPLYQDFLCIESGGMAVDVPNGRYRVLVNLDNPSGFWGEYQSYSKRSVLAEGKPVVVDTMDFASFQKKYFRFWNVEDLPSDNTFDKYQKAYYHEKTFDVDVSDGQLNLEFQGANWACSVSAVVIFPVEKAEQGEKFLKYVEGKRRFYFDNYFRRVLHRPTGDPLAPSDEDRRRGFVLFQRDWMQDVYYNDTPRAAEIGAPLQARAFAGEYEPITLGVAPLKDLGLATLRVSDLTGTDGQGTIPSRAIDVGYVSYRVTRVTAEGTVYTIAPRLVMPGGEVQMPQGVTRRYWLTLKTPADARPGRYRGTVSLSTEKGGAAETPLEVKVCRGTLDPVDVPAGPWGYTVHIPWHGNDQAATLACLRKMREYGFTTFSGMPEIHYRGFKAGKPVLDFSRADGPMQTAKDLGFLAVVSYGRGIAGFNAYFQDKAAMTAAGFQDYSAFIKAVYAAVQEHAAEHQWLTVYYNLGDEPIGDDVIRSAENAEAYRKAFPKGPPWFTAASSFQGSKREDPHFRLAKAPHIIDWNGHDEASVDLLHEAGGQWAFYNGGNRWTFGDYMYKAVQRGMKFRLSWHWNAAAGDPYYALDCREDDYAWANGSPDGRLIPSVHFEQLREGLDDYRRLATLARLAREKGGTAAAQAAEKLIGDRMAGFRLGQRDHDALFGPDDWSAFRRKTDEAIEALR